MTLDLVRTFVDVVRANGFSAAAKRTGTPRSTVSLRVKSLEAALGTRLLKRSTRAIALTDDGQSLYRQAVGALDTLSRALDDVRNATGALRGLIRLTAPADFPTELLARAVTDFSRRHPAVRFQIMLTNAALDMVRDDIDIAVRVGGPRAPDSVEKPLLVVDWGFYAGTDWIARHGRPQSVQAIEDFIAPMPALRAYLERSLLGGAVLPEAAIEVDSHLMARDLVVRGCGVGLLPTGLCADAVARGQVHPLLTGAIGGRTRLSLVFPTRADMVPRVRAFAEHLSALFGAVR